jgi:hypothetical protein
MGGALKVGKMGQEKGTGEIKIHTKFQFETLKGKGKLGVQVLDGILKTI